MWWAGWPRRHFLWLPEWELLGKTAREMPSMWAPKQPSLPGSYQGGEILVIRHPGQTRGEEHNLGPLNMTQLASQAATKASICSGWRLNRQKEIRVRPIDSSPRGCLLGIASLLSNMFSTFPTAALDRFWVVPGINCVLCMLEDIWWKLWHSLNNSICD